MQQGLQQLVCEARTVWISYQQIIEQGSYKHLAQIPSSCLWIIRVLIDQLNSNFNELTFNYLLQTLRFIIFKLDSSNCFQLLQNTMSLRKQESGFTDTYRTGRPCSSFKLSDHCSYSPSRNANNFSQTTNLHNLNNDLKNDSPILMGDTSSLSCQNQCNNKLNKTYKNNNNNTRHQSLMGFEGCSGNGCTILVKGLQAKLAKMEQKLNLAMLKIQELESVNALDSTKYMEYLNRVINLEKKSEKVEYSIWQLKEFAKNDKKLMEEMCQNLASKDQELKSRIQQLVLDIAVYKSERVEIDGSIHQTRSRMETMKIDTQRKMKQMYEALEEIGNLQAGLVDAVNKLKKEGDYFTSSNKENTSGLVNIKSYTTGQSKGKRHTQYFY